MLERMHKYTSLGACLNKSHLLNIYVTEGNIHQYPQHSFCRTQPARTHSTSKITRN
uniref:Candidate secreted effector n=1 Tax=Meloidogyne incognita TaxID=6306 RepID=A0A914MG07_MELIC